MRLTERVKEIIEMNTTNYFITLVLQTERAHVIPIYYARIIREYTLGIPVTNATNIGDILKTRIPAIAMVADRHGGYEAYLLEGKASYVSDEADYQFVAEMRNIVPSFPIHGGVLFEIEAVHLIPPP